MQLRTSLTYLDHNRARERERKMRGGHDEADEASTGEESDDDVEEGTKDEFQAKKDKLEQMKLLEAKPEAKVLTVRSAAFASVDGRDLVRPGEHAQ